MKLILASICAVTCLSGEPAKACDYFCQSEIEERQNLIELRMSVLEREQESMEIKQSIHQANRYLQEGF